MEYTISCSDVKTAGHLMVQDGQGIAHHARSADCPQEHLERVSRVLAGLVAGDDACDDAPVAADAHGTGNTMVGDHHHRPPQAPDFVHIAYAMCCLARPSRDKHPRALALAGGLIR